MDISVDHLGNYYIYQSSFLCYDVSSQMVSKTVLMKEHGLVALRIEWRGFVMAGFWEIATQCWFHLSSIIAAEDLRWEPLG